MQSNRILDRKIDNKDFSRREFPMLEKNFEFLSKMANKETGIQLGEHKRDLVYSRIVRRIRVLKLKNFNQYCEYLVRNKDKELGDFVNAITTNLTSFFREKHHFDFLSDTVYPEIIAQKKSSKKIRAWSAGCSTGEEPYSLAISLDKTFGSKKEWDVKVLATDLDTNVLSFGREGIYTPERLDGLSRSITHNNFTKIPNPDGRGSVFSVSDHLRRYITFNQLNLLNEWPIKGKFDFIFCRNVVIYFNKETQQILFDRYANALKPNGYLFIGHSETLHGVTTRFESLGKTVYRKIS
ncbi:hypothetical protein A9Q99_08280 [Gammaproteobacteria bacterium 45_16_T64]|nr:hypothetical protein A9Q99_08280 [Gammaproteobacteria bacterium 45_16_T64]